MSAAVGAARRKSLSRRPARTLSWLLGILLALLASAAGAQILSLDCTSNGELMLNVWVDLDKSFVTVQGAKRPNLPLRTYVARITQTTIKWKWSNSGGTSSASIDRRTGTFYETYHDTGGGSEASGPYQCTKGSVPLPAAKF
ncbi:exported hypothetical protein [Burkholderiales bacterium]|nr:exported hypothetical protein [Burkholderiales bacterium]